jgi:hypothetical protein
MSAALPMACGHSSPALVERPAPHLRGDEGHEHASAPLPDPARVEEVGLSALLAFADVHSPSLRVSRSPRARARAATAAASQTLPETEAEEDATEFLLDGEIAAARSAMVAAAERARSYGTEVLPRFEENLTLLTRAFELGEIDLLELSIGRERFLRIQSDALSAQLDYFVALANLERTIGAELWRDEHGEEP